MRENEKSRMTPVFWPERLEEWQCRFLAEMETVMVGMGVLRFGRENQ